MPPGAVVHIRTGWAVLTIRAVVARWVWERYPFLGPGGMSLLKSAMVSNETLAAFWTISKTARIEEGNKSSHITVCL